MKVDVKFFAAAREATGARQTTEELSEGATLEDLQAQLYEQYPDLEKLQLRFAVNSSYAKSETALEEGDEVACIPPVGGG